MSDAVRLVIWAQSMCRSTMALYREVRRLPRIDATVVLRQSDCAEAARRLREMQGQEDYSDVVDVVWNGCVASGKELLGKGSVHVFSGYQASAAIRYLMCEAKMRGCRVVGYDEAPCEMCLGVKAVLKRAYYRFALPWRASKAVKAADLFISASGNMGIDRLLRLGWKREQIVPFGYVSPKLGKGEAKDEPRENGKLRVLHLGSEAKYRAVSVAEKAVARVEGVELVKTGGGLGVAELVSEIRRADVVVACGLCEPWGMRVNDVLLEGVPVVVSDGMGAAKLCDDYGCGCVVPKGDAKALATVLQRCADDRRFLEHLKSGAIKASKALLPENMAQEWVGKVIGK